MSDGVPVRGSCKNGHTLTTVAPKGRVTWRGPCPENGCDGSIIAKRIATTARTDPTPATAPVPAGRKFRVVKGYRDEPTPTEFERHDPDDGDGPGGPPGVPADPPDPVDPAGGSPPPGSDDDEPRGVGSEGGVRRRSVGRLLRRGPAGPRVAPPGLGDDHRVYRGIY